ncbi:MAG: hypothetical protein VB049_00335 [Candidatus Pelethousia sp.]|nr:hypothetical protein [Candidatus Pelethousia sp.]
MKTNSRVLWITQTAAFIALLVILQVGTAPLGNMLITGAVVNLLLVVSVMTCGLLSGVTVSLLSPILAKLFGIGPLWSLIPFITLGNLTLCIVWHCILTNAKSKGPGTYLAATVGAAVAKFLVLYLGIVKLAIPVLLRLPEKQALVVSGMFSIPQLITALIGGAVAAMILPVLQKSVRQK